MNVIVVLDQERVYNDLKKHFGNKVQIIHLPKSGGVRNIPQRKFHLIIAAILNTDSEDPGEVPEFPFSCYLNGCLP